ncbi:hypothetical protein EJ08DRAFT_444990 [Tothia fuscella]|uniref:Glutamine amidotransferase type-2 domain-containing protein n=1 Tax=Tothia fuscella TaxID=1048955 RepID=A0A9P4NJ80_9PEZI|nr:hypothetical protein EJ08DRAFT_444990 [Tothia fuscella]
MCGIFCTISRNGFLSPSENATRLLKHRGPDNFHEHQVTVNTKDNQEIFLSLSASVLCLRGTPLVPQPIVDPDSGCALCWNGEVWRLEGEQLPVLDGSDTKLIFKLLCEAASSRESHIQIPKVIERIRGPFAMVFYDGFSKKIYYGRDSLGRRSLLRTVTPSGDLVISSISDKDLSTCWSEDEAEGIQIIEISQLTANSSFPPVELTMPYVVLQSEREQNSEELVDPVARPDPLIQLPYGTLNKDINPPSTSTRLNISSHPLTIFERLLRLSLAPRVSGIRLSGQDVECECPQSEAEPRIAILFSGGLDCTLLARIISDVIFSPTEAIDLLNVAFQNPRIHKGELGYELCPDRITARSSLAELQNICPRRPFRLVCINVPFTESQGHRQEIIDLMHPHNTEMDLSIAYALYFAARGIGETTTDDGKIIPYATPARVLISGLGADELFAGYMRHATAFSRKSWPGLLDEMELDIDRLGKRNLGRDDRVISHWGKEARYPFLDEDVVVWTLQAPFWEKVGFGMTRSIASEIEKNEDEGELDIEDGKLLLRLLAWKLGMKGVAREKKRAVSIHDS